MPDENAIRFIPLSDARDILGNHPFSNMVFWVGAGVDYDEPRCLPLASDLVDYLLGFLLGGDSFTRFQEMWAACNSALLPGEDKSPRLETLVDAIKVFEHGLDGNYSILEGMRFFDDAPANLNCMLLAQALVGGSDVVTTNYSLEIERCAQCINEGYAFDSVVDEEFPTFVSSVPAKGNFGTVYHIHGVSDQPHSMGITLPLISRRFPSAFSRYLDERFHDSSTLVVFAGYSGSDEYDVNKHFEDMALASGEGGCGAQALYLRHGEAGSQPHPKEERLMVPFSEKFISVADLRDVLSCSRPVVPRELRKPWKEAFNAHVAWPDTVEEQLALGRLFMLALSDYLGLNLGDAVGWNQQAANLRGLLSEKGAWYAEYYSIRLAEMSADHDAIVAMSGDIPEGESLGRTFAEAVGNKGEANRLHVPLDQALDNLRRCCGDGSRVTWDNVSSSLNHFTYEALECELTGWDSSESWAPGGRSETLDLLMECADEAKIVPYDQVDSLRQIAIARRSAAVTRAMFLRDEDEPESFEDIDIALGIYEDICSTNGYETTLAAKAFIVSRWQARQGGCLEGQDDPLSLLARARESACLAKDNHALDKIALFESLCRKGGEAV